MPQTPGNNTFWASDVRVSMPVPSTWPRGMTMGGFVFTAGGLAHDISEADFMSMSTPNFHPGDTSLDQVYEDVDVDAPPARILGVF
jgi:hypothetical protein